MLVKKERKAARPKEEGSGELRCPREEEVRELLPTLQFQLVCLGVVKKIQKTLTVPGKGS